MSHSYKSQSYEPHIFHDQVHNKKEPDHLHDHGSRKPLGTPYTSDVNSDSHPISDSFVLPAKCAKQADSRPRFIAAFL